MPDRVGLSQTWRDEAVAVVVGRLRGPLRPKGRPLASEQAVRALAESIVDSLPLREDRMAGEVDWSGERMVIKSWVRRWVTAWEREEPTDV